jgi:hypothetical protein
MDANAGPYVSFLDAVQSSMALYPSTVLSGAADATREGGAAVDHADVDDDDFDVLHRLRFVRERRGSDLAAEDFSAAEHGGGAHGLHGGEGEADADDDGFVAIAVGGAVPGARRERGWCGEAGGGLGAPGEGRCGWRVGREDRCCAGRGVREVRAGH